MLLVLPRLALAGCGGGGETVTVYLKQRLGRESPHGEIAPVLMPVAHPRREGVSAARQAVLELSTGPSPDERAHGFEAAVDPKTRLRRIAVARGTATVELAERSRTSMPAPRSSTR